MSTSSAPRTRLAQPPTPPPVVPLPQDSKCSTHQMDPILFLLTVLRVVQAYSAWCSALSRGSSPTEIRRRPVLRFPRSQDGDSIFACRVNSYDGLCHRCHTCTRVWQYEGSTSVEDHDVAFVNHSWCELPPSILPNCLSFHLRGPRIVVLSLSPLKVSNRHLAIRLGSQQILPHRSRR